MIKSALPKIIPELAMDRPLPSPDPGLNADCTRAKAAAGVVGPSLQRSGGLDAGSCYRHKQVTHQRPHRKAISPGFFATDQEAEREQARRARTRPPLVDIVRVMPDKISTLELARFVNTECGLAPGELPSPHNTYSSGQIRDELKEQGFIQLTKNGTVYFVRAGSEAEAKLRRQPEVVPVGPGRPSLDLSDRATVATPTQEQQAAVDQSIQRKLHRRTLSATSPPTNTTQEEDKK